MRKWLLTGLWIAAAAHAAPPDSRSPMLLPNAGGYLQPGNPNRGITAVGRESALVRASERAAARKPAKHSSTPVDNRPRRNRR